MTRHGKYWLLLGVFVLLLLCRASLADPSIHLRSVSFDPLESSPGASLQAGSLQSRYKIVQCTGPVQPGWREAIQAAGVQVLGYVPDFSFLVRATPGSESLLRKLSFVRWVGPYLAAYKISPRLTRRGFATKNGTGRSGYTLVLFPDEDVKAVKPKLAAVGVNSTAGSRHILRVEAPASALPAIADIEEVQWIEEYRKPELHNRTGRAIMETDSVWTDVGLYGGSQIIAVCDTGLDTGDSGTVSPDFSGRIHAVHALGRPNDWSDPHAHGTHVCGSVLGNGSASGSNPPSHSYENSFAGIAPEARLVMQSVLDVTGGLGGIPVDLNDLFQQAWDDGARIHSNSWGAFAYGEYTEDSRNVDLFAWNHKDCTILFSVGNWGMDENLDGVTDAGLLASPATAKNCIAVGASESLNYTNEFTYGSMWQSEFPINPLYNDFASDNAWGLAAFSGRGPCMDGRTKPDLCAPGTNIISTRCHAGNAGNLWGIFDANHLYSGGTSMATALTAGAACLVREYFLSTLGWESVSSAMIKAVLINGAADMTPGQYGTGAGRELLGRPDRSQGWGRLDLRASLASNGNTRDFIENNAGLSTGESVTYSYEITRGSAVRFTLVYTDYPATIGVQTQLVNDLDLVVTDPNGTRFYPNRRTSADRRNPVEDVQINGTASVTGTYTVTVSAYNIPNGPQPYALVTRIIPGPADLTACTKTVRPVESVHVGDILNYRLDVRDIYGMGITDVTVTDVLPAEVTYIPGSTRRNNVLVPDVDEQCPLVSGITANPYSWITFQAAVNPNLPDGSLITNTATFQANGGTPITRTASSTVRSIPNMNSHPSVLSESLPPGGTASDTLVVSNTGNALLEFTASAGPYYQWKDSTQPGGPVYEWVDVSTDGIPITGLGDDGFAGPLPIGFDFKYYGHIYRQFYVSSNGFIGFGPASGYGTWRNESIPGTMQPNNIICWNWDDLREETDSRVYYRTRSDHLIVQFNNYGCYGYPDARITAEVILKRSGEILVQYSSVSMDWPVNSATIGIEDQSGIDGVQVVYNSSYMHGNLALRFFGGAPSDCQWTDTNKDEGLVFNWIDITSTGTLVNPFPEDSCTGPYTIGFDFPYFGAAYSCFYISDNGFIGFGSSTDYGSYSNGAVPDPSTPNNIICWNWANLMQRLESRIFYQTLPEGCIIQFNDYGIYGYSDARITSEVILKRDGEIIIQFLSVSSMWQIAPGTIGIENDTGVFGIQAVTNERYLRPGLAIRFQTPSHWLRVTPGYGTVLPGESMNLAVEYDASNLAQTDYYTTIRLHGNDPNHPAVHIPVTLNVTGSGYYCTSGGYIRHGRWNLVSLPADPDNPDPLVVFSGIDIPNASFQYWRNDLGAGGYQNYGNLDGWIGPVFRGIAYWLKDYNTSVDKDICFAGFLPPRDFELTIPAHPRAPFWIIFGTPFAEPVAADSLLFRNVSKRGDRWLSWVEAYSDSDPSLRLVDSNAQGWDASKDSYAGVAPTPWMGSHQFEPWWGYWLLVYDTGELKIRFQRP